MEGFLAVFAFMPVTLCTGYLALWLTNLRGFRERTLVERIFWSIPTSIGVSTISIILVARFVSLSAAVVLLALITSGCLTILLFEITIKFRSASPIASGLNPLGGLSALSCAAWIFFAIASLVDFEHNQRLFMSLTFFDHGARVNWAESILRTGVPPLNPEYFAGKPATLRYYYFWLTDCAAAAKLSGLPMRAVTVASCIWSAFAVVAVLGLYLKHFLRVGLRLRSQFVAATVLLVITGPYIVIDAWDMFIAHRAPPGLEVWPEGQITSWLGNFFFYPHHAVALACCMLGFLLAWMDDEPPFRSRLATPIIIAACFASAFGLSVYVAFAFFLIMLVWSAWELIIERAARPVVKLIFGGMVATLLLMPYLSELTSGNSKMHGQRPFSLAVRETIPPQVVLSIPFLKELTTAHSQTAANVTKLLLLIPGYTIELGFYFIVFMIFLVAFRRDRSKLSPAHRALLIIGLAAVPCMSFIRSEVLNINDFGIHAGMFLEFPLLLLGSELVIQTRGQGSAALQHAVAIPKWSIPVAKTLAGLGILSTIYIAFMLRFGILVLPDTPEHSLSHKAYISTLGYAHLTAAIPSDSVVQFNPSFNETFWKNTDLINVNRQIAIGSDLGSCGSELGGDPSFCPSMISSIAPLFRAGSADQARAVCRAYGIHDLIANVYDPVWKDGNSWVWTLKPVVADREFRALDCR